MKNKLRDVYWRFLHRFWPSKQFHIVRTSLDPGYYDPDIRIQQVMFELTKEFIETAQVCWECEEHHQKAYNELKEAVNWYFNEKPWFESLITWDHDSDLEAEDEIYKLSQLYMKKIVDNLGYIWYP